MDSLRSLGPALAHHFPILLRHLHDYYHRRDLTRVLSAQGPWWPVVDSIMFPGVWLKLHQLHSGETANTPLAPVFGVLVSAHDDPQYQLRPVLAHEVGEKATHVRHRLGPFPVKRIEDCPIKLARVSLQPAQCRRG